MRKIVSLLIVTSLFLSGCAIDPYTGEPRPTHAGVGAGIGAVSGALIGSTTGSSGGALIGAGIGALAGGAIGNSIDQQEAMFRHDLAHTGVRVVRARDDIQLIMPSDITFANDSDAIKPRFDPVLNSISRVLRRYHRTTVRVAGFTSSTGSETHNQRLSERRATSVADYLSAHGVHPNRIFAIGYGKRHPVASNDTAQGRALNRRVELTIQPIG